MQRKNLKFKICKSFKILVQTVHETELLIRAPNQSMAAMRLRLFQAMLTNVYRINHEDPLILEQTTQIVLV